MNGHCDYSKFCYQQAQDHCECEKMLAHVLNLRAVIIGLAYLV